MKRVERDHAKEKQKLVKDKDAGMPICPGSNGHLSETLTETRKQRAS